MRRFAGVLHGSRTILVAAVIGLLPVATTQTEAAIKELANDSLTSGGSLSCQIGFIEGESGAVKLTAESGDYPYRILKARMFICPGSSGGFVIFRIYEDNTGTVLPGPLL
jgi:hypothetical protein